MAVVAVVTIKNLAEQIKISVTRLRQLFKEAGIELTDDDDQ